MTRFCLPVAMLALSHAALAFQVTINGSSTDVSPFGTINFNSLPSPNITFSPAAGYSFGYAGCSTSLGPCPTTFLTASGRLDHPVGGYTVGAISTTVVGPVTFQIAPVSGTGMLTLDENSVLGGAVFTAAMTFNTVSTTTIGGAGGGTLQNTVTAALTGFSCAGCTNALLLELLGDQSALMTISWTSASAGTLSSLFSGDQTRQYTLQIESLPEPGFYGVLATCLGGLFVLRYRRRAKAPVTD